MNLKENSMERYQRDAIKARINELTDAITEAETNLLEYMIGWIDRLDKENEKLIGDNVDLEHEIQLLQSDNLILKKVIDIRTHEVELLQGGENTDE